MTVKMAVVTVIVIICKTWFNFFLGVSERPIFWRLSLFL